MDKLMEINFYILGFTFMRDYAINFLKSMNYPAASCGELNPTDFASFFKLLA
jgi:hypothetical protein